MNPNYHANTIGGDAIYYNSIVNFQAEYAKSIGAEDYLSLEGAWVSRLLNYNLTNGSGALSGIQFSATYFLPVLRKLNILGWDDNITYLGAGLDYVINPKMTRVIPGLGIDEQYNYNSAVGFHIIAKLISHSDFFGIKTIPYISLRYVAQTLTLGSVDSSGVNYPPSSLSASFNDMKSVESGGFTFEAGYIFNL